MCPYYFIYLFFLPPSLLFTILWYFFFLAIFCSLPSFISALLALMSVAMARSIQDGVFVLNAERKMNVAAMHHSLPCVWGCVGVRHQCLVGMCARLQLNMLSFEWPYYFNGDTRGSDQFTGLENLKSLMIRGKNIEVKLKSLSKTLVNITTQIWIIFECCIRVILLIKANKPLVTLSCCWTFLLCPFSSCSFWKVPRLRLIRSTLTCAHYWWCWVITAAWLSMWWTAWPLSHDFSPTPSMTNSVTRWWWETYVEFCVKTGRLILRHQLLFIQRLVFDFILVN